ncbi:MAG: NadS family protein [Candidatus Omnitrophica bacterium]|nr:NadS family protein [Candidatus Omnitrophota bacterium]MDD5774936.1 NadS family protein [Candidatus Omnitrophota bacterium]
MKKNDFNDLLRSVDQMKMIKAGRMKPGRVSKFQPILVKRIRRKLHASQAEFAHLIGISVDTLQNWEQGRRRPVGPALVLLRVTDVDPGLVMRVVNST